MKGSLILNASVAGYNFAAVGFQVAGGHVGWAVVSALCLAINISMTVWCARRLREV